MENIENIQDQNVDLAEVEEYIPSETEKSQAMTCNLLALIGLILPIPFLNICVPLIYWLLKRQKSEFVSQSGRRLLNFQISIKIYLTLAYMIIFLLVRVTYITFVIFKTNIVIAGIANILYILLAPILIIGIIITIKAALKAKKGELYEFPCSLLFIN